MQGRRPLGHMSQTPCSKPTPSFEALVSVYCAKRPGQSLFFIAFSSAFRGAVRPGQTPLGHMSQTLRTAVGCYPDSILVSAVAIGRAVPIKRHHPSLQDQYLKLHWSFSSHPLPHLRTCLAPSHAPHLRAPLQAFARVGSTTPRSVIGVMRSPFVDSLRNPSRRAQTRFAGKGPLTSPPAPSRP